jgi:hypothetical protein
MRRVLAASGIAVVLVLLLTVPPAGAGNGGPQGSGSAGAGGASAGAGNGEGVAPVSTGGGHGGGSSGCPQGYTYDPWTNLGGGVFAIGNGAGITITAGQSAPQLGGEMVPAGTTSVTDVYCGGTFVGTVFGGPGGPVLPASPAQLAQQAEASAPFHPIQVVTSPPSSREAVNFPIFLSLGSGFAAVSATASAGGVTSTVTITPTGVTWAMGDGHSVSCAGPGVPYDPSRSFASQLPPVCGYEYSRSSANQPGGVFVVTATVHFSAKWTVSGAPGGGALPAVDRSVTLPVTVGEIQILNS